MSPVLVLRTGVAVLVTRLRALSAFSAFVSSGTMDRSSITPSVEMLELHRLSSYTQGRRRRDLGETDGTRCIVLPAFVLSVRTPDKGHGDLN